MRQIVWLAVLVWMAAAASTSAFAATAERSLPVVELVAGRSAGEIKSAIRYADAEHEGPPVTTDLAAARPVDHASTQFGTVGQSVYVFVRMRNAGSEPGAWMFTTGRSSITEFTLYRREGANWKVMLDGSDRAALGPVLSRYQAYAAEVGLAPGEEALYAIRFRDEVSSWMPLSIETFGDFFTARRSNISLVAGVVIGSLILALLNVVLLAATGQRVFVWLGLAEAAFAFNTLHAEGYLAIFWLYQNPPLQSVFGDISRTVFGLLMLQFGREFLATRERMPRYDRFLRATMALGGLVVAGALIHLALPVVPTMPLHAAGWLFTLVASSALPVIGWVATRRYGLQFLPLLVGWAALAVYIVTTAIAISGLVPFLAVNWHWIGPIGLFDCLMATLAVGFHLRQLQTDRLVAEQEAKRELLARIAISEDASRLAEERAKALAGMHARDRLIEMATHDTRHVLHALSSAVFLARHGTDLPPRDLMTLIEASARHLEEIVGSSITVDHGDGRFLALGVIDAQRLLEDLVTIYSAAALSGDVLLSSSCPAGVQIITDEALLVRVLSNLLNNALRATQAGRIEISCEARGSCLALTVSDTGPGMPQHIADYLVSHDDVIGCEVMPEGFGKGWRAIRETVSLLHGDYTVQTGPEGTRVTVNLPLLSGPAQTVSQKQLEAEFPGLCFIDEDAVTSSEIAMALRRRDEGQVPVFIASRATPEHRIQAATLGHLLLIRPLVRSMMDHPYVLEMTARPEARARSTS
jgi:signal transduction histidine kinase